ncbi:MAG: DUF4838 domain-containing protein [Kiritimatiellae bacterium]|nr:DUF4838 domain-containing protein [Kiritimatiellia bacterium]
MTGIRRPAAVVVGAVSMALAIEADGANLVLASDGRSLAPIVVASSADANTLRAADELADYIAKISGAEPDVLVGSPSPVPAHAIWVGYQSRLDGLFPGVDFSYDHPEEIVIASTSEHLAITGNDRVLGGKQVEFGTANAVYTFLQKYLDVRWLWPGELGEDIVKRSTLALAPFTYRHHPQLRQRDILRLWGMDRPNAKGPNLDWMLRQRLYLRSLGSPAGHSFTDWWDKYRASHRDYFALQPDGTRSGYPAPENAKLCVANPAVATQWLDNVSATLAADASQTLFGALPNDSYLSGVCVCDRCRAWDCLDAPRDWTYYWAGHSERYVALTDRYVTFWNRLAAGLKARFPGRALYVVGGAYGTYQSPPIDVTPAENIVINYVGHFPLTKESFRTRQKQEWLGWAAKASMLVYRPNLWYWAGGCWGLPEVAMTETIEDFAFLRANRCVGIIIDSAWGHWATQGPEYYIMGQLAWDPYQDGAAVMADYYSRGFGPAAGDVASYWGVMEEARRQAMAVPGLSLGGAYKVEILDALRQAYDEDCLAGAGALLDAAEDKVRTGPAVYRRRVAFVRTGFEYARMLMRAAAHMDAIRATDGGNKAAIDEVERIWDRVDVICATVTNSFNTTYLTSRIRGGGYMGDMEDYLGPADSDFRAAPPTPGVTAPAAPTGLAADAISAERVRLSWRDHADNEYLYKVYRSPNGVSGWVRVDPYGACPPNTTAFVDDGLEALTRYYYRVRCRNAGGNSAYTSVVSAQTPAVTRTPAAPTAFEARAVSAERVELTWTDNSDNEENFKIRRSLDGTDWVSLPPLLPSADTSRYVDTGVSPNTTYYYRIKAEHATFGDSPYTDPPVQVRTPRPAGPFVCYNDLAWTAGQRAGNITCYTRGEHGLLVDHESGALVLAMASVNSGGAGPELEQGADAAAGTDAADVFGGKVDCAGLISYDAENPLVLHVSELDPALRYELVVFGNRAKPVYSTRKTSVTISNVAGFRNRSSAGARIGTIDLTDDTTQTVNGDNTADGRVARFDEIAVWPNGELTVTIRDPSGYPYVNAFMLAAVQPDARTMPIGRESEWKYHDGGVALGTAWRNTAFNDGGWDEGSGPLGYGEPGLATTVSYGGDAGDKHRTTYFRKAFALDVGPAAVTGLRLYARYDDGFVAYLNGREVARRSMPGGTVSYATFADSHEALTYELVDLTAERDALVQGANVLAVEVHQTSAGSSDLVMDMELVLDRVARGWQVVTTVARGDAWRYRKGTDEASSPSSAWRRVAFDDSDWTPGATPLGYGRANLATDLDDMRTRYNSLFLRKRFAVANATLISEVSVQVDYDDAFILWLNGEELTRHNMGGAPGSQVAYDAVALGSATGSWRRVLSGAALPPLLDRTNLVAVQVFNSGLNSADLFIDVEIGVTEGSRLSVERDGDLDGMDDAWEAVNFTSDNGAPGEDDDGDGIDNESEYIAGTSPQSADSRFALTVESSHGQMRVILPTRPASGTGYAGLTRYYAIEQRSRMGPNDVWSLVPGYIRVLGTGATVIYTNSTPDSLGCYRGRVWLE